MIKLKEFYRRWNTSRQDRRIEHIIRTSGFFDPEYYLRTNPDVSNAGVDAFCHYLRRGRREGRSPSPDFDPGFYLLSNPDVAQSGLDPVAHYLTHGRYEGRPALPAREIIRRSGLFDSKFYRAAYLDVALAGVEALQHYVDHGRYEGRRPSLNFDPAVYLASNPDLQGKDIDPIMHYIQNGRSEGRRCSHGSGLTAEELPSVIAQIRSSNLFDDVFYLRQCPSVQEAGVDPLYHYLFGGFAKYVDPSPRFSTFAYIRAHPGIYSSDTNPLLHLLQGAQDDDKYTSTSRQGGTEHANDRSPSPPDQVDFERNAAIVYARRYLLSFDSAEPGKYVREAIEDLSATPAKKDSTESRASIIVPVFGQMQHVLNCLDSLRRQRSRYPAEVIILDDASPDIAQARHLQVIPWIRYKLRESQGGFLDACRAGAEMARGRVLVFLSSRTRVADGWLDELIGSFDLFPKAGLIGSKLFNEDGTLQEAGGVYRADGTARRCGQQEDGNHPKYCYARQVDFLSGVSVAIRADVWNRMKPQCKDTDLASQVREAGYEVWLQPLSSVIHYEDQAVSRISMQVSQ